MSQKRVTKLSTEIDSRLYIEGMRRNDLACKVGMTNSYLSCILSGQQRMSIKASNRIAEALGMEGKALRRLALEIERGRETI